MLNFQYVLPFPCRMVAHGTESLAAGASASYSGVDNRNKRLALIISNLDAALVLRLCKANGEIFSTIWPLVTHSFPISEDIKILNPNGAPVSYQVGELFFDPGTETPQQFAPGSKGGTAGGGGSGGSYGGGGNNPGYGGGGIGTPGGGGNRVQ